MRTPAREAASSASRPALRDFEEEPLSKGLETIPSVWMDALETVAKWRALRCLRTKLAMSTAYATQSAGGYAAAADVEAEPKPKVT